MTSPMYTFAVPVFKQMLMALKAVLAQASAHATAHSIEPDALLQARLYPDMFALAKQVQIAADFARGRARRTTTCASILRKRRRPFSKSLRTSYTRRRPYPE